MASTVPCMNPTHGVATHHARSLIARECAKSMSGRGGRTRSGMPAIALSMNTSASGHLTIADNDFGDFLRDTAAEEFDRVHAEHPGYTNRQIIEAAAENMMGEIDDVDSAWSSIPPDHRSESVRNVRVKRSDLTHYIEGYMLSTF